MGLAKLKWTQQMSRKIQQRKKKADVKKVLTLLYCFFRTFLKQKEEHARS